MQHRRRGPDSHAHRAEGQHHRAEPYPPGHRLTTQPRPRRSLAARLIVDSGVYSPVDFLADALDQTLGHGGVVAGAEITVCRRRGPDFIGDAHGATLSTGGAGNTGASTRFQAPAGPMKSVSAGRLGECLSSLLPTSRACCSSWARSCSKGGTGSSSRRYCTVTSVPRCEISVCRSTCASAKESSCSGSPTASGAASRPGRRPRARSRSGCRTCPALPGCACRCGWPRHKRPSPPPPWG